MTKGRRATNYLFISRDAYSFGDTFLHILLRVIANNAYFLNNANNLIQTIRVISLIRIFVNTHFFGVICITIPLPPGRGFMVT